MAAVEPDAELMLRVKEGDSASFDLLIDKYRLPVVRFLYRMVLNQAIAEDLAQEVFLRVYRARAGYEPSAKFATWLFRIAVNMALNHLRNGKWERAGQSLDADMDGSEPVQVADSGPDPEQALVREARLAEVRRAVEALPPKQRAAVLMHKYEEMDYAQIAKVLGCSEPALKSSLFRAYETLRARLAHMA